MFHTFTGNSRRPRQVNLSGQNQNPFAAGAWGSPASGTQQTVASAQQERQHRQQEREKLNATKRIQRTWRGHKSRKDLADSLRAVWDEAAMGEVTTAGPASTLPEQARLLVHFYNPRRRDDLARLMDLSQRISSVGYLSFLASEEAQTHLPKLAQAALQALKLSLPECPYPVLQLLVGTVDQRQDIFPQISDKYYSYFSTLLKMNQSGKLNKNLIMTAIRIPLQERPGAVDTSDKVINAYASFAMYFLTTPDLAHLLGGLEDFAIAVDTGYLSTALIREFSSSVTYEINPENRLWLLAHFISLNHHRQPNGQEPEFLRALSLQISSSSSDIIDRIDFTDPEAMTEEGTDKAAIQALPSFVKEELLALVDKASISGLLEKFNVDYAKVPAAEEDASLLASYVLTLLRIFPRRSDDIRMWLYLGSMNTSSENQIPALKFFWHAVSKTNIFASVTADSKAALTVLRPQIQQTSSSSSSSDMSRDHEWRTILLLLELYTFVLRITDDEEFLSPSTTSLIRGDGPLSRVRESALPLDNVKQLTIFLKNLAFTMYYNAGELSDGDQHAMEGGLGSYFGTAPTSRFRSPEPMPPKLVANRPFAGIAGMTFDYVRSIVTGAMRMLYERDSRRRFLPKDHWLMTSRFEMEGFIPAVVMEEERRHEVVEDDEEHVEDSGLYETENDRVGLIGMGRPRRAQQIEAMRKAQQHAARQKILAAVGPRLEVLQNMPFVIPFETRVQIFRQFVLLDQTRRRGGNVDPDVWRMAVMQQAQFQPRHNRLAGHELLGRHHAKIRRDQIFDDAYEQFYELGEGLKEPIQITFVDQFDTVEAGIDGGGVTKEFLTSITNEAFRSENGPNLFSTNDQNLLYPNPSALDERRELLKEAGLREHNREWHESIKDLLRQYEFLGRIVGKCLYEGILVDIGFAGFFLRKWAASTESGGYRANINDLRDLDEELYQGLLKLKNYPGNVEDFSLDFTITDSISYAGAPTITIEKELRPNGANIPVTNENRLLYLSYVARHRLQVQPYQQTQAFLRGLGEIIKPSWLSMFNQSELQTLIGGDSCEIDVEDLRRNTLYGGVYQIGDDGEEHSTVKLFWKVLKELDDEDRRKLLKYVTSTPRAPLLGFSQLNPRFSIRDAGNDEERLPSTSTCVNLLKLPRYSTASTLKEKLLYAVNSGAGFDLS